MSIVLGLKSVNILLTIIPLGFEVLKSANIRRFWNIKSSNMHNHRRCPELKKMSISPIVYIFCKMLIGNSALFYCVFKVKATLLAVGEYV